MNPDKQNWLVCHGQILKILLHRASQKSSQGDVFKPHAFLQKSLVKDRGGRQRGWHRLTASRHSPTTLPSKMLHGRAAPWRLRKWGLPLAAGRVRQKGSRALLLVAGPPLCPQAPASPILTKMSRAESNVSSHAEFGAVVVWGVCSSLLVPPGTDRACGFEGFSARRQLCDGNCDANPLSRGPWRTK